MSAADVLVVEDREADRDLLCMLLEHAGHHVRTAGHGGDALELARHQRPDLVIADVVLPGIGGFELAASMRADAELATVPFVLCSAYFTAADAALAAMELGVDAIVPKPIEASVLESVVARALASTDVVFGAVPTVAALRSLNAKLAQTIGQLERLSAERGALLAALVDAQEAERRRVALEVHDDSIQTMYGLSLELQLVERTAEDPDLVARCTGLRGLVDAAVGRLRVLVEGLRPPDLDTGSLGDALRRLAASCPTPVVVDATAAGGASEVVAVNLYRIAQEALLNASRHARATVVRVVLADEDGGLRLVVRDDGAGMADPDSSPAAGHFGLTGMRERAVLAGGRLRISSAPGAGTTVDAWVPL